MSWIRPVCGVVAALLLSLPVSSGQLPTAATGLLASSGNTLAQLNELQRRCEHNDNACLQSTRQLLATQPKASHLWYQLQIRQLDLLFRSQQDEALWQLCESLLTQNQLPDAFRARLYIYYAKLLHQRQHPQAQAYFRRAKQLLGDWQHSTQEPQGYVRLYNLELYFTERLPFAYQQLQLIAGKYAQRQDPMFQYDLWNNLGHFAQKLLDPAAAVKQRQQALYWALQSNHTGIQAQAHFNLARQYSMAEQWQAAVPHFAKATELYLQAEDPIAIHEAWLFSAEALWRTGQPKQAHQLFAKVNAGQLPAHRQAALIEIRHLLLNNGS